MPLNEEEEEEVKWVEDSTKNATDAVILKAMTIKQASQTLCVLKNTLGKWPKDIPLSKAVYLISPQIGRLTKDVDNEMVTFIS